MNKKQKNNFILLLIALLCYFLASPISVRAQSGLIVNPDPSHFLFNKGTIFPSAYKVKKYGANVYYQNRLGLLSGIRNIYADGILTSDNGHIVGVKVFSAQETSLFSKSKLFLIYGYRIRLGEKTDWVLATQAGMANVFFGASSSSAGGSDWKIDGSLSTTLTIGSLEMGVAMHQVPSSKLRPINYEFRLNRYVEAYLSKKWDLNELLQWESGVGGRMVGSVNLYQIYNQLTYREKFSGYMRVNTNYEMAIGVLMAIPSNYGKLSFFADYIMNLSTNFGTQSRVTVGLMLGAGK